MTWCKGCKKDLSPSKFFTMQSGFCDNCVDRAGDMCDSGDYCDDCPEKEECGVVNV